MGLRRGFIQSGARNLLMTLWPISDETTVQIMTDFYDAFKTGDGPPSPRRCAARLAREAAQRTRPASPAPSS
jgi:hypothetical protein